MNSSNRDVTGDGPASPRSNLTRLLTPLRAQLATAEHGYTLDLESLPAADAFDLLAALRPRPESEILLSTPGDAPEAMEILASFSRRIDQPDFDGHLVVNDHRLLSLFGDDVPDDFDAVIIDGPIEAADVAAVARARAADVSALTADLRAETTLRVTRSRTLRIESRDVDAALRFVAACLRRYVGALRGVPLSNVVPPDLGLIHRIFERTGSMQVRPIETEVYSTSIDIGIMTHTDQGGPADTSLVFDLFGHSWHGD